VGTAGQFFKPYDEAHIKRLRDTSYGMVRVEEVCAAAAAIWVTSSPTPSSTASVTV